MDWGHHGCGLSVSICMDVGSIIGFPYFGQSSQTFSLLVKCSVLRLVSLSRRKIFAKIGFLSSIERWSSM